MSEEESTAERTSPAVPESDATAETGDEAATGLDGLATQDGWQVEGEAARVHYSGATDRYSIEYYAPSECVLYWKVPPEDAGETAVPVGRETVPAPLRERICEDLASAGIDPEIEGQNL